MIRFNVSPAQRFVLFICATALCFIIGSVIVGIVLYGGMSPARMRIATVLQDLVMFILPALVTAMIITRRPATFLSIDRKPDVASVVLVIAALVASVPAMNVVISWNESLTLPESMSGLESWMRSSEQSAGDMVKALISGTSVGSLVLAILIMGILAGFSEELFFRGTFQRLLITTPVNAHVAIWITAVVFSAIHMQFFGFVPRLLLGAFFGYLAWWSGSVWLAVIAHIVNNTCAAVSMWISARGGVDFNEIGVSSSSFDREAVILSIIVTSFLIRIIYKRSRILNSCNDDLRKEQSF